MKVEADSSSKGSLSVSGYSVVQAESIEAAKKLMEGHPHFFMPGAAIEILECIPMG